MNPKNLNDWLEKIEHQVKGEAIQLGLERIANTYQELALGKLTPKVITVSGTNGKGSTVAMCESLLEAHGYKVASFTSPHLINFNERIKVNGHPVCDQRIIESFELIDKTRSAHSLTYFEWVTLAALVIYHQEPLDVIILEVGLGGRYDAVNIIDSDVAVITSISLDHVAFLGTSLAAIAKEKAGIMRAHRPVVLGGKNPQPELFDYANEIKAKVVCPFRDSEVTFESRLWSYQSHRSHFVNLPYPKLLVENAISAIAALEALNITLKDDLVSKVMGEVFVAGRQEWCANGHFLLDVAHNEASVRALAEQLKSITQPVKLLFAMREDKDYQSCFEYLEPYVTDVYIGAYHSENSVMAGFFHQYSKVHYVGHVLDAYQQLLDNAQPEDIIVVTGSFQTVGIVKKTGYHLSGFKDSTKGYK